MAPSRPFFVARPFLGRKPRAAHPFALPVALADNGHMVTALLALGSNMGDRAAHLNAALAGLRAAAGIERVVASSLVASAAVGGRTPQPEFLNAAARLETTLTPPQLLNLLRTLERNQGRERHERWGARTLDLDLLLYGQLVLLTPDLVLPHPRLAWRPFVLEPAAEVAPDLVHAGMGWTMAHLWRHWRESPACLACCGPAAARVAPWLQANCQKMGCRLEVTICEPGPWPAKPTYGPQCGLPGGAPRVIIECRASGLEPVALPAALAGRAPVLVVEWPEVAEEIPSWAAQELLALLECLK